MITTSELLEIMSHAGTRADACLEPLNVALDEFSIDTPDRQAAFLAQIAHETGELAHFEENMNYSAERIVAVWPGRFANVAAAVPYAHNPPALANRVYCNRGGNGDEASGDGWAHRGAGAIQLTFKDAQTACATYFDVPVAEIVAWLRTAEGAFRSAAWFWKTNGLNTLADQGQFKAITRRINSGLDGLDKRTAFWDRARAVLA